MRPVRYELKDEFVKRVPPSRNNIVVFNSHKTGKVFWLTYRVADHSELKCYEDAPNNTSIISCSGCRRFLTPEDVAMDKTGDRRFFAHAKHVHNASYVISPSYKVFGENRANIVAWFPIKKPEPAHALAHHCAIDLNRNLPQMCLYQQRGSVLIKNSQGLVACKYCNYTYRNQDLSGHAAFTRQFPEHYSAKHGKLKPPHIDDLMGMWRALTMTDDGGGPSSS